MDARPQWLSLLPLRLLRAPVTGGTLRFAGVVLVADVSGFTALSETVARSGAAGTEELSRTINEVFGPLVELVHGHGGEVAHFIGDAVVAVFEGEADAARSALDCAARMDVSTWPAGLALTVGLAAGTLTSVVAGDPAVRLEHVLIGSALRRAALNDAAARRAVEALARSGDDRRLAPRAPVTAIAREEAAAFVHPSVAERLDAGRDRMLAEHRHVTALFVNFEDLDENDPAAPVRLRHVVMTAVRTLSRFGGALLQVELVDKGSTLKAMFGAPRAHEDDERRAAACALALREALPDAAFGLSSGTVLCGLIGSAARREYTVLGDAVNVAARLMLAAMPGQILASEPVRRRAGEEWAWRALGALALRGRAEPVDAFELAGRAAAPAPRPRGPADLVGRTRELERLIDALDAARERAGGVLVVSGEAGIGKSRLLAALVETARERRVTILRGTGQPYRRDHPYGAWRDAARALALDERDPLLAPLFGVAVKDITGLTPEVRAGALHELVVERIRAADQPLLLVFEDAQWLDRPSRALLERVAAELPSLPVLLVVSERSGEAQFPGERLALGPLSPQAIERIVGDTLRDASAAIVARVGGNPLYAKELARLVADGQPQTLPESLRAVVNARLDKLGEDERAVLRVASVVGTRFAPEWVSGSDPSLSDVAPALARLTQLGVVRPEGAMYAFNHAVTREVAYETLAFEAREHLHAAIARYVERTHALDRPDVLEALAHHYGASAEADKQRLYFRRAGDVARAAFANESAIRHYRRLLGLLDADERVSAMLDLGAVLQLTGASTEAQAHFEQALECARAPGAAARARAALGGLLAVTAAYPQAVLQLEQARADFEALGDAQALAGTLERLSHTYFQQGDDERAMRRAQEHAELARTLRDRAAEGTAIGTQALVLWHQGELEPARDQLEASLALAEAAGNRVGVVHGLNDLAGVLVALQRPADALDRLAQAYTLANELGYRRFAGLIVGNAAELFQTLGLQDAALACAARSLRIAEALRDVLAVVHNAMVIAAVRRRQGKPAEAEQLLARVIEVAAAADNRRYLAEAWQHRARAYRDLGRPADARRAEAEALALAQGLAFEDDPAPTPPPPLANPFAEGRTPEPAELVRQAEDALIRLLGANHVK